MNKAVVLLTLGVAAIFVQVQSITCPIDDENSQATYYPHETQCGMFYECVAGSAKLFQCPEGLYWDQRLSVCNWDVNCGALLTSTPSPATPTTSTTTPVPSTTDSPPPTDDSPTTTDSPPPTDDSPATTDNPDITDTPDS